MDEPLGEQLDASEAIIRAQTAADYSRELRRRWRAQLAAIRALPEAPAR